MELVFKFLFACTLFAIPVIVKKTREARDMSAEVAILFATFLTVAWFFIGLLTYQTIF